MLTLTILARAAKSLAKLPAAEAQTIVDKLESYARDRNAAVDVKPLKGMKNAFRLRHGDWRALFEVNARAKTMLVVDVVNRKDAYK